MIKRVTTCTRIIMLLFSRILLVQSFLEYQMQSIIRSNRELIIVLKAAVILYKEYAILFCNTQGRGRGRRGQSCNWVIGF